MGAHGAGGWLCPVSLSLCVCADVVHAFQLFGEKKSFVVMASTAEEKALWMSKLTWYANQALAAEDAAGVGAGSGVGRPREGAKEFAPAWVPDAHVTHCTLCRTARFSAFQRRVRGRVQREQEDVPH
jgi:hypothetical protein